MHFHRMHPGKGQGLPMVREKQDAHLPEAFAM
jgi:hypothetical protein